jgi:hypothetical protein
MAACGPDDGSSAPIDQESNPSASATTLPTEPATPPTFAEPTIAFFQAEDRNIYVTAGDGGPTGPSLEGRIFIYESQPGSDPVQVAHLGWIECGAYYDAGGYAILVVGRGQTANLADGTSRSGDRGPAAYLIEPQWPITVEGDARCTNADGSLRLEESFPLIATVPDDAPVDLVISPIACRDGIVLDGLHADPQTYELLGCWDSGTFLFRFDQDPDLTPGDEEAEQNCMGVQWDSSGFGFCGAEPAEVYDHGSVIVSTGPSDVVTLEVSTTEGDYMLIGAVEGFAVAILDELDTASQLRLHHRDGSIEDLDRP